MVFVAENDPAASTSECWGHSHEPQHPVYVVLGMEPMTSCGLGKLSTSRAKFPALEQASLWSRLLLSSLLLRK